MSRLPSNNAMMKTVMASSTRLKPDSGSRVMRSRKDVRPVAVHAGGVRGRNENNAVIGILPVFHIVRWHARTRGCSRPCGDEDDIFSGNAVERQGTEIVIVGLIFRYAIEEYPPPFVVLQPRGNGYRRYGVG